MAEQITIILNDAGYVDEAQALQLAQAICRETDGDLDAVYEWIHTGDFRAGEVVTVAALVDGWDEYTRVEVERDDIGGYQIQY